MMRCESIVRESRRRTDALILMIIILGLLCSQLLSCISGRHLMCTLDHDDAPSVFAQTFSVSLFHLLLSIFPFIHLPTTHPLLLLHPSSSSNVYSTPPISFQKENGEKIHRDLLPLFSYSTDKSLKGGGETIKYKKERKEKRKKYMDKRRGGDEERMNRIFGWKEMQ